MDYSQERAQELSRNLSAVRQQIEEAATDLTGARSSNSSLPQLTVVTKFFPAEDVAALYDLGVRTVGENRDQEASSKAEILSDYTDTTDPLLWSYIGQLQSNKAKSVVKYASEIHSVDRLSLVKALGRAYANQLSRYESGEAPAPAALDRGGLSCLIQVNLDDAAETTAGHSAQGLRGGADTADVRALADLIETTDGLHCAGVMAVAPLGADPDRAFQKLHQISQQLQETHPGATEISAGMSGDLESAIKWGSTNVRVGSQIMGPRPLVN